MTYSSDSIPFSFFVPGEVLALLTPLQELESGLYVVQSIIDNWVTLTWLIDEEETERLIITEQHSMLPAELLELFTPVGLRLSSYD